MMRLQIFLFLVISSAKQINCYKRWWPLHFSVEGFTDAQFQIISEAADAWNTALGTPEVYLWKQIENQESNMFRFKAVNNTFAGATTLASIYAYDASVNSGTWIINEVQVSISHNLVENNLYNTALHELGHALGLLHSTKSEVMGWTLNLNKMSHRVSINKQDVDELSRTNQKFWWWSSFFKDV